MNELSTKLYKLNFQELVDNATNKEYWNKKWEIFKYDGMTVEFMLNSINIIHNKLEGKISLIGGNQDWRAPILYITIPLQKDNFNKIALEKELCGKVDTLFLEQGRLDLMKTEEYKELQRLESDFNDQLEDIAKQFLKENNVFNKEIIEVYVDNYVSNNQKDFTSDYLSENKPKMYVPHRVTFCYIMGFEEKAEWIIEESGEVDCEYIFEQAEELRLQLENDDLQDYKDELEDI